MFSVFPKFFILYCYLKSVLKRTGNILKTIENVMLMFDISNASHDPKNQKFVLIHSAYNLVVFENFIC